LFTLKIILPTRCLEWQADTLRRLEEEQQQFEAFMDRLRAAKDQSEFDEFMKDRSRKTEDKSTQAEA
jgi:nicotinamide riboside kinase